MKFLKENSIRFFKNPFEKNFEPIFQSAYERFKILKKIESCPEIISNFIYRENIVLGQNQLMNVKNLHWNTMKILGNQII